MDSGRGLLRGRSLDRGLRIAVAFGLLAASCRDGGERPPLGGPPAQAQPITRRFEVRIAGHRAEVEAATTPETRETGLMFRDSLDPDCGMLFVFPEEGIRSFWMKNTRIPLSLAYLRADGTIVEILDMAPETTRAHVSKAPARYALEMTAGWFRERLLRAGDRVEMPAELLSLPVR